MKECTNEQKNMRERTNERTNELASEQMRTDRSEETINLEIKVSGNQLWTTSYCSTQYKHKGIN